MIATIKQAPGHNPLNFRVTDAKTKVPLVERVRPTQNNFSSEKAAFVTNADGPFNFCVDNLGTDRETVTLKISSGVAANDFSDLPTSKEVQKSTSMISSIEKKLADITESLRTLRAREDDFRATSETIYSRVWSYSFCSIGLLVGLCVFQLVYLKIFFKQKKLA